MSVQGVALLAGLFGAPALLLWLGHGLRHRGPRGRGVFWGAVVGHGVGMAVTLAAALAPPVAWEAGVGRAVLVHGSLALGAVVGGLLAVLGVLVREARRGGAS